MSLAQQINRVVAPFEVISEFQPAGDQPTAIAELTERIKNGEKDVVLLGATGTGKSATTAWLIEQVQRPTLVMVQNKTLAAQLVNEFRELLPNNAVEYFVSYYDYYQPEAYVAQTDILKLNSIGLDGQLPTAGIRSAGTAFFLLSSSLSLSTPSTALKAPAHDHPLLFSPELQRRWR